MLAVTLSTKTRKGFINLKTTSKTEMSLQRLNASLLYSTCNFNTVSRQHLYMCVRDILVYEY